MLRLVRLLAVMLLILPGFGQADGLTTFPTDHLTIVGADGQRHDFTVEMASTPEQLTQGLMFRHMLAANAGMLFDFHDVKPVAMWMKNTLIPLDMIFIDGEGVVVGVAERAVPQSLSIIPSPAPARAVLEVNGGTAHAMGLKAGDRVIHPLFGGAR